MKQKQHRDTWLSHVSKGIARPAMCVITTCAMAVLARGEPRMIQTGELGSRPVTAPPPFLPDIKTPAPARVKEAPDAERVAAMAAPQVQSAPAPMAREPGVGPAQGRPRFEITEVLFQNGPDGTMWARGANYKASFDTQGFTYIPFLGSDAPRNFPIRFTIESVTAGSKAVAFANANAAPVVEDQGESKRVSIDRGSFIEAYDLRLNSVEQLFTFANRPASGDVKIRLSVDSEWTLSDGGERLIFTNDLGSVTYSKAVVVDANARRTNVATHIAHDSNAIDITLPASLLATASYPLTVDPIIAVHDIEVGLDDRSPDVSYDASNDHYIAVWENSFSAADGDVWAQRLNFNGEPLETPFTVDFTTANWRNPRVANNNFANNYLVVAERGAVGSRAIWGALVSADDGTVGPQFEISEANIGDKFNPDVGGDTFNGGEVFYLVVWERQFTASDHDVHGRLVTETGVPSGGTILIDNTGGTLHIRPSVASNNNEEEWLVAWQEDNATDDEILGSLINYDGAVNEPTFSIDTSGSDNQNPSVSSRTNDGRYMVVYEENPTTQGDIWARVMGGTSIIFGGNLTSIEGVATDRARRRPHVETNGIEFVVTQEQFFGAPFTDYDAYISSYCWSGGTFTLAEPHRRLSGSIDDDAEIRLASNAANGGGFIEEFLAIWCIRDSSGFGDIYNAFYETGTCCPSDVNDDGQTDVDDLIAIILNWGGCITCAADVNGDFNVDVDDLIAVILGWGTCS